MIEIVRIKSLKRGTVGITVPSLNLRRTWPRKGAVQTIPFVTLEQAFYEPGVSYMFTSGILFIEDIEVRIALGLEPEGTTPETSQLLALTDEKGKELLIQTPLKDFRETLDKMSLMQLEELTSIAVKLELTDYQRCKLLQDKTGKDVLKIVLRNKEEEEKDKETSNS